MGSGLANAKAAVESTWEDLTPAAGVINDGGPRRYCFIDTFVEERGGGGHRELLWFPASDFAVVEESPVAITWNVPLELYMRRMDRNHDQFVEQTEEEIEDLVNSWAGITSPGTNVRELFIRGGGLDGERTEAAQRSAGLILPELLVVRFDFIITAAAS